MFVVVISREGGSKVVGIHATFKTAIKSRVELEAAGQRCWIQFVENSCNLAGEESVHSYVDIIGYRKRDDYSNEVYLIPRGERTVYSQRITTFFSVAHPPPTNCPQHVLDKFIVCDIKSK